jgi:ribosomal protein S6--L-glutamate ligase
MNAAIISMGSISSKWVAEALKKYFDEVDLLEIIELEVSLGGRKAEILYQGEPIKHYDCIYAKGSFRYANLLRSITSMFCERCYTPVMEEAFAAGHDKLLTHIKLQKYAVPMPETRVATTAEAAKAILKKMTYPVVIKMPSGTHGKGVMIAESRSSASSMIDALALLKQPFLLQEFIDTGGTDIRAFVVGEKVVAAMRRTAVKGEARSNIHAGGKGTAAAIDKKIEKIAISAARAMGVDICGVDIMESARGPLVLEVNVSPGMQGITKATGIDVAGEVAKFLFEKTKQKQSGMTTEKAKKEIKEKMAMPAQEILAKLSFRGERILLPEFVTKLAGFKEDQEVTIKAEKGKLEVNE